MDEIYYYNYFQLYLRNYYKIYGKIEIVIIIDNIINMKNIFRLFNLGILGRKDR